MMTRAESSASPHKYTRRQWKRIKKLSKDAVKRAQGAVVDAGTVAVAVVGPGAAAAAAAGMPAAGAAAPAAGAEPLAGETAGAEGPANPKPFGPVSKGLGFRV